MLENHRSARRILSIVVLLVAPGLAATVSAQTGVWTTQGPDGGSVQMVAADPRGQGTFYAAASTGGVFKTVNAGTTWRAMNEGLPSLSFFGIAIDPERPSTLYAFAPTSSSGGLWRSRDAAATWEALDLGPVHSSVRALVVDPSSTSTLYLASRGIGKSTDRGDTWRSASDGLPERAYVNALAIDPRDTETLYAVVFDQGIYRTRDGGETWRSVNAGLADAGFARSIFVDPETSYVFAGVGQIFRSTDGADTWVAVGGPSSVRGFRADPVTSDLYAVRFRSLWRSIDRGASWFEHERLDDSTLLNGMEVDPAGRLYLATSCGVLRQESAGWLAANAGLVSTRVEALAADPMEPSIRYAATSYCHGFKSLDGGATWTTLPGTDRGSGPWALVLDPSDRFTLYAAGGGGIYKSTDGGRTWEPRAAGVNVRSSGGSLVIARSDPRVLYVAMGPYLFRTTDGAATWTMPSSREDFWSRALAVDPTDAATVYAGTRRGGVMKSTDAGETWRDLGGGLPQSVVELLETDAEDPSIVYTAASGRLYRSIDGGESWRTAGGGLADEGGPMALLSDPGRPATLYAAVRGGVFKSLDRGDTWRRLGQADFAYRILDLAMAGSRITAGTTNGAYELAEVCGDQLVPHGARIAVGAGARPRAAVDRAGRTFAVWSSADGDAVWGRAFDVAGRPMGSRFRIDGGGGRDPAVAGDAAGRVLTVWQSVPDGGNATILGRAFDVEGMARGKAFRVDREPRRAALTPALGQNRRGAAVALWASVSESLRYLIRGQRLSPAGELAGAPFTVAPAAGTPAADRLMLPAAAVDDRGVVIAAWLEQRDFRLSVMVRRFKPNGEGLGPVLEANDAGADVRRAAPAVAAAPDGGFVVAWQELSPGEPSAVAARWYDAAGRATGSTRYLVEALTARSPDVTVSVDRFGNTLLAWVDGRRPSYVAVRLFDDKGEPSGDTVRLGAGDSPWAAFDEAGRVVLVWGDETAIRGKRFRLRCTDP